MSAPAVPPVSDEVKRELLAAARAARHHAYAPYSHYQVGAAVLADGKIFSGANIENASYGLALCAERSAVAAAVVAGARRVDAVAVVTGSRPAAAPCGMCRQTLAEFALNMVILTATEVSEKDELVDIVGTTLEELLPRAFRGDSLG